MYESQSEIVLELAQSLISLVRDDAASWNEAYYRFECEGGHTKSTASYRDAERVTLISALRKKEFFDWRGALASDLFAFFREPKGVLLLVATSDFSFDVRYEFANVDRWQITKLNGGTGIPAGLE